ncbi:MAG: PhnD/SsuA/transferrin family substrate-binding protein [Pseudomonadota bacterium]|nr:PhnD/SsuA/transferrin family substrate-binding protein [Pseudomonadota bacterium]
MATSGVSRFLLALVLCIAVGGTTAETAPVRDIRIGVLSHRGDAVTTRKWTPTARYLSDALPGYRFHIEPLDFAEVDPAVADGRVDFVLVNPGIYVNLEVRHRVSRIATMSNRLGDVQLNVFGGVIFTRADRENIQTLQDLRGRSFMAVDRTSLGGFEMAWGELAADDIDPYRDFSHLSFGGIHDAVVLAVLRGDVDAGTVRTDILERMAAAGSIEIGDFRILNPLVDPDFPFVRSTPLYPEWPFSKVRHTPNALAQQVAIALMQMPADHAAAGAGEYAGWTIPLDYQPVHRLLEDLGLPPYDQVGSFTLGDAIQRYWFGLLLGAASLLVMAFLTTWVMRLNQSLTRAKARLEQRQELILNSVAEGISGVDLQGRTTFVNEPMEKITGWQADELIGHNQHEILHHTRADGSPHPADACPVYATFRDNLPRYVDDDVFWRKDGTSFPVEYSSTPIRDERGETVGSVVVFRDVTERKLAAEKIRHHQVELAHVARLSTLGEMASGIAHELNQPLTAINTNARACIRMLESGRSTQEYCSDVMEKIAAQAERAGEVIRHIRHFVRKEEPELRPARLSGMLDTVIGLLRPDAQRASVTLELDLSEDAEWVLAQEIQIEQVILNLARNAIEAMADTPSGQRRLSLRSRRLDSGQVQIQVSDTGPGLSEEVAERIFEPFVTTKIQGLGLGLSISNGIVETHGGQLSVESGSGTGATFHFTLPVSGPAENA